MNDLSSLAGFSPNPVTGLASHPVPTSLGSGARAVSVWPPQKRVFRIYIFSILYNTRCFLHRTTALQIAFEPSFWVTFRSPGGESAPSATAQWWYGGPTAQNLHTDREKTLSFVKKCVSLAVFLCEK